MLARDTRPRQNSSTPVERRAAENADDQEVTRQPVQGADGMMMLPSDLQAKFDESFRRNEAGLRYLATR